MLDGKRLLITGVVTRDSIAYHVAERAQGLGAEVVLTGFGRAPRPPARRARRLPAVPDVLELDVNREEDLLALRQALDERRGGVDGVLHAVALATPDGLGGGLPPPRRPTAQSRPSAPAPTRSRRWPRRWCRSCRAAPSPGSTSTPRSPGPRTTGWAWRRRRWSRSRGTWRATSGRAACA